MASRDQPWVARSRSAIFATRRCHCSGCGRSEEHTSELQSQSNLVCRLLLEKKTKKTPQRDWSTDVGNEADPLTSNHSFRAISLPRRCVFQVLSRGQTHGDSYSIDRRERRLD